MTELYYDASSPGSYGGVHRFAQAAGLKHAKAEKLLSGERVYTLHKQVRKRFNTRPYKTGGLDHNWQADLVEMIPYASTNKNYRYILTVIDLFSRYGWAKPLKNKTGQDVKRAFEEIFESSGRKPLKLQTDQGKEFENKVFQDFLKERGISFFTLSSVYKAAFAEKFNRTLKSRMWRYFSHVGNHKWLDVLPNLVASYNASIHRVTGMKPENVDKDVEIELWLKQEGLLPQKVTQRNPNKVFKVGDWVKLAITNKNIFAKGYTPTFTSMTFVVNAVLCTDPIQYKVKSLLDGTKSGKV